MRSGKQGLVRSTANSSTSSRHDQQPRQQQQERKRRAPTAPATTTKRRKRKTATVKDHINMTLVPGITKSFNLLNVTRVFPRLAPAHHQDAPSRSFATKDNDIALVIPKKPSGQFFRFLEDMRPAVQSANPHLKNKEIQKVIAQQWKDLEESKKEAYKDQATKDLEAWKVEMSRLKNDPSTRDAYSDHQKMKQEARLKKSVRRARMARKELEQEAQMPKRPSTPVILYLKENVENWRREAIAKGIVKPKGTDLISINAVNWKKESEETKKKYLDEYNRQMEVYEAKMNAWKEENMSNDEYMKAVEKLSEAKKKMKDQK